MGLCGIDGAMIKAEKLSDGYDYGFVGEITSVDPNPIIKGMNDLPCNPIRCMILSMIKAARDM